MPPSSSAPIRDPRAEVRSDAIGQPTQAAEIADREARLRGRDALAPWRIPLLGWKDIFWRTYRAIGRDRLPSLAGGVTFFLLLALFPALAAFVSVYGFFLDLGRVERQLAQLTAILPREAVGLIGDQMVRLASRPQSTLGAAFVGSTLASVWSANAGMKSLFDGLNVAYGETEKRPYLQRSLTTYAATLSTVAFLVAVTAMTVAAPIVLHALGLHYLRLWWAPVRWLIVYLIAAQAFTLVYRFGPSRGAGAVAMGVLRRGPGGAGMAGRLSGVFDLHRHCFGPGSHLWLPGVHGRPDAVAVVFPHGGAGGRGAQRRDRAPDRP